MRAHREVNTTISTNPVIRFDSYTYVEMHTWKTETQMLARWKLQLQFGQAKFSMGFGTSVIAWQILLCLN